MMLCEGQLSLCKRDIRKLRACDGHAGAADVFLQPVANLMSCWSSTVPKSPSGFGTSPKILLLSACPPHVARYPPGAGPGEQSRHRDGGGTRMEEVQGWRS